MQDVSLVNNYVCRVGIAWFVDEQPSGSFFGCFPKKNVATEGIKAGQATYVVIVELSGHHNVIQLCRRERRPGAVIATGIPLGGWKERLLKTRGGHSTVSFLS